MYNARCTVWMNETRATGVLQINEPQRYLQADSALSLPVAAETRYNGV